MESLCKLYLELANVVPETCISVREIKLLGLLREARRYVSYAITLEHAAAVLSDIDAALSHLTEK